MLKKSVYLSLILLFVFGIGVFSAQAAVSVKKKPAVKKAANKKAVVKKIPIVKATSLKSSETVVTEESTSQDTEDQTAQLKEDMNNALADLKSQIDTVKSDNGDAKIGGTIFFNWSKTISNITKTTAPNAFDVSRAYLNFTKKLAGDSASRVTLDVKRVSDDTKNQNLFGYLKYAYFETPLPVSTLQFVPFNMNAKIGLQQNAWIDWEDSIMGMRYVMKTFVDDEGLMSSSDFGAGVNGKITPAGLPEIEYNTTVVNGAGYATNEGDSKKAVAMRLNSTVYQDPIWGNVIVGLFGNISSVKTDLSPNGSDTLAGGLVALKGELGMIYVEDVTGKKGTKSIGGYSGQLVANAGVIGVPALNAFYRQDYYQPDTSTTSTDINKSFYGLTYDWNKDIKVAADVQSSQTGSGKTTSVLYLNTSVAF